MSKRSAFPVAIFTCFVVLTLLNTVSAQELDEFLVAYWPFDEDGGNEVIDATENGNNGTITGASWTDGKFESALEFNGVNNHVAIPDSDTLDLTTEITISFWAKFNDLPPGDWKNPLRKEGSYVLEVTGENQLQMNTWAGGNWATGQAFGGPNLQTDTWYFLAGTKLPEAGLEAYIDGERIAVGDKEGDIDITGNQLFIGSGAAAWLPMSGIIDEVKIFNKALTGDEIKKVMRESGGIIGVEPQSKATTTWGNIKAEYAW